MPRHSPTLRDVWNAVPLAGRAVLLVGAAALAVAVVMRLAGPGGRPTAAVPAAAVAASTSSTSPAYRDGYRMGSGLLALGLAPVSAGMDTTAEQTCERGIEDNVDVQQSLTRDLAQKDQWYAGCRDAVEQRAGR